MHHKQISNMQLAKIHKKYPLLDNWAAVIHPGVWGQLRDVALKPIRERIKEVTGWRDQDLNWQQVGNIRGRLREMGDRDTLKLFDDAVKRYNSKMEDLRERAIELYETS